MEGVEECWLITQPAHAALSGEIAAKLKPDVFGTMDEITVRAIALHDAGWGPIDANAIQSSRAIGSKKSSKNGSVRLLPFMSVSANEAVNAWTGSVDVVEKITPLGGYLVSEHFRSIAAMQAGSNQQKSPAAMAKFISQEQARQRKLRPKISIADQQIQRLVEGLRFCDLLSLYLCSGAHESIEFPQQIGGKNIVLTRTAENECTLAPFPFSADEIFYISALRHPKKKDQSSGSFFLKVVG
jgi:hypothetical protein